MKKWQFITTVFVCLTAGLVNVYFDEQRRQDRLPMPLRSEIVIDGERYAVLHRWWSADPEQPALSWLVLYHIIGHGKIGEILIQLPISHGPDEFATKRDVLYFVRDGKIVCVKSYQELGIDQSRLNARRGLAYLRPILANLIREHVTPQESETEKPNHVNP